MFMLRKVDTDRKRLMSGNLSHGQKKITLSVFTF